MNKKFIIAILLILFSILIQKSADATSSVLFYNNKGIDALENEDYPSAIAYFKKAQKIEPENLVVKKNLAIAYNNYGIALLDDEKFDAAIQMLVEAQKLFPDDKSFLQNIARAYNRKGIKLLEEKDYIAAKNYFSDAIRFQPKEKQFRKNLSIAITNQARELYDNKDYEAAEQTLLEALLYDNENSYSMVYLGDIYYQNQELEMALNYYRKAYQLNKEFDFLEKKIKEIEKEIEVEGKMQRVMYSIFDIRFDKENEDSHIDEVRRILSDAFYEIGSYFGYYPEHKIVVIFYSAEDFKKIRKVPDWTSGLYDGKIRIPYSRKLKNRKLLKRLIRHEYTHVIIHALAKGNCATWFNEGLAKYMEYLDTESNWSMPILRKNYKRNTLMHIGDLEKEFVKIKNIEKVSLAYAQSYSMVEFIINDYGFYKIKEMLKKFAEGMSTEKVIKSDFYRSVEEFEKNWLDYLSRKF